MRWKNMINVTVVVATVAVAGLLIAAAETVLATGVGGVSIGGGGGGGIGGGGVGVDGGGGGGGGGGRLRGAATATPTRQLQQKEEIDIDSDDESMRTPAAVQCASCSAHKEIKTLSIELIKISILNKLGMQHPPEFGGRLPPPVPTDLPPLKAMLHDYNDRSSLPLPRIRHQMHHYEASGDGGSDMQSDEATGFAAAAAATFASIDTYNSASIAGGGYSGGGGGGGSGGGGYSSGYGDDDDDDDDYHVKTHKLIAYAQPHPTVQKVRNHNLLFFTFSDQTRQHRITEVILWVYKRRLDVVIDDPVVQIDVYRINLNTNHPTLMSTIKRTINNTEPMWVPIDLHKRKSEWFRSADGAKNLTLSVHAYYASKNITHIRTPFVTDAKKKDDMAEIPYLEVHTREDRRSRARRNAAFELTCNETSVEPRCCRYPLTVDFEEFGWHWIIAPKKYVANYCSGLCDPTLFHKNPHTHLVQMTKLGKGPCCAPRKMSALSMLYYDNDYNIIYGLLPGMVVDRCGCS